MKPTRWRWERRCTPGGFVDWQCGDYVVWNNGGYSGPGGGGPEWEASFQGVRLEMVGVSRADAIEYCRYHAAKMEKTSD